jgi:hypothetical protein
MADTLRLTATLMVEDLEALHRAFGWDASHCSAVPGAVVSRYPRVDQD